MFSIAESYAISRLSQPKITPGRQAELSIEFSKTLSAHAESVSFEQQPEMWKRAKSVVDDVVTAAPKHPFELSLKSQSARVYADQAIWMAAEVDVSPFDPVVRDRASRLCQSAIDEMKEIESRIDRMIRPVTNPQSEKIMSLPGRDIRSEQQSIRFTLATLVLRHGELASANSKERRIRTADAEQLFRQVIGSSDERLSARSRVGLVSCARLRGTYDRALEMIVALEKSEPTPTGETAEWIVVEKVRNLQEQKLDDKALATIVRQRTANKSLSGELWYLQLVSLISMRQLAIQKSDERVADQVRQQIEVTLERCDEQSGGYWSRRCRTRWGSNKSTEKYGPQLEGLIQQAKGEFLGGQIDSSLERYSQAQLMAAASGQTDLAVEMAYTRSSILLNEKRFEEAAAEFLRVARDFPDHGRAAAANWNGVYSLGRHHEQHPG
ncbi:MAG: hypothetical protein FJ267_14695, partial [Planctomycetes bacterium]|nr:hypothetical protein [Planctomycetota bacterium]